MIVVKPGSLILPTEIILLLYNNHHQSSPLFSVSVSVSVRVSLLCAMLPSVCLATSRQRLR